MNKVFKVIWSEARNAYVVVSEIAKNMGSKSCSTKKLLAMLIATGVMTCAGMAPAMAANLAPNDTLIAIGKDATVGQRGETNSIAVGYQAEATAKNAIAIGYQAKANVTNAETSENTTTNEQAVDPANAIAIGYQAEATNANAAAIGYLARASGENAAALGYNTIASGKNSIALGNKAEAIAENATALGNTAKAHGVNSTALGAWASTDGTQATAVGYHSEASALESTAIGNNSSAAVTGSVALGSYSVANREANSSTGYLAPDTEDIKSVTTWTANKAAVSVGGNGTTRQIMNVAAGEYDTDAVNVAQLRVVNEAAKAAKTVIKAGDNVTVDAATDAEDGHTIYTINATDTDTTYSAGNGIKIDSSDGNKISVKLKEGEQNLSFDEDGNLSLNITQAVVYKDNDPNKAIMSTNAGEVADDATIALGKGANAKKKGSFAIGNNASAEDEYTIAIGEGTTSTRDHAVAMGIDAKAQAPGSIAIGNKAEVGANGDVGAIAIGNKSYANGLTSVALGNNAKAMESNTVAIGLSKAEKSGSVAIGQAQTFGANSIALGEAGTYSDAINSVAIGENALAHKENSITVGYQSQAKANDSVALGSWSVADRKAGSIGYLSPQEDYSAEDSAKPEVAAWKSTLGAVSVGAKLEEGGQTYQATRQITNVAAGFDLTDAVNVAQLQVVKAEADKHTTLTNGTNTKVEEVETEDGHLAYKVHVQGDLSGITSISNGSSTITLNNGNVVVNKVTINSDGRISGVANGTEDSDAVNVSQLKTAKTEVAAGTNVTSVVKTQGADGQDIYTINTKDTTYSAGDNVTIDANNKISATDTKYTAGNGISIDSNNNNAISVKLKNGEQNLVVNQDGLSLNQNLNVTSVNAGGTVINNGGLSIGGNTYVSSNGLNASGQKITNVANGTEDSDAVNYGQLKAIEQTAGNGWNVSTNGGTATKVAPGDTVDFAGDSNISVSNEGKNVKVALKNDISVNKITTNYAYVTNVDETNNSSVTNVDYVNKQIAGSALSAGNGIDITNKVVSVKLKEGEQNLVVDASGLSLNQEISVSKVTTNNAYVTNVDASKGSSVTNVDYVNQKAAAAKTEVAAGTNVVSVEKTQGGNGQDIYTVNAKDTTVSGDSNISATAEDKGNNVTNYKLQLASDLNGITSISNNNGASIKLSNSNVVVNNKVTINSDGRISGVADGDISKNSKDAVNGSQLYEVQQQAGKHSKVEAGTNTNVEATNQDGQMVYKVNLNSDILLKDLTSETGKYVSISGTEGTIKTTGSITTKDRVYAENGGKLANIDVTGNKISNGSSSITMDGSNVKVNDKVTIDQTGKISGVADGDISETSTDAINGSQLNDTNNRVTKVEGDITNIKGDIKDIKVDITNINTKLDEHTTQINQNTQNITNLDNRVTEVEKTAGKHSSVSTEDSNIIIDEGTNTVGGTDYKLSLNKNQVLDSVKTGDTVMNNDGIKVGDKVSVTKDAVTAGNTSISNDGLKVGDKTYVNSDGLNANSQKVTNVADGEISATSKDAVNGSQLHAASEQIIDNSNRISRLGNRINKVGAGAAALAALHPMDFDPDDKWSFAAGYGNYAGENAAAIGAYYRPDEKVMFSVGGTVGNGENMVNAGISFALDRTNHVSNSRTALAREVIDLRSQLVEMGAKMAKMEAMLGVLDESKTKLFPDVPANHWAYEYIAKLAGNGILEGYPDGTFGGDRLMTRYEFATMLYRAIEKGAALEERIINEFAPELGRIRVDRISGKDSDRNKIERVRVNGPRSERDHYGSKLK